MLLVGAVSVFICDFSESRLTQIEPSEGRLNIESRGQFDRRNRGSAAESACTGVAD
jgi:hypothetical protein